jgi:hypothetical protein
LGFQSKNIIFYFEKCNIVNLEVLGLAPGCKKPTSDPNENEAIGPERVKPAGLDFADKASSHHDAQSVTP